MKLTERQLEIMKWATEGLTNKEIAREVGISPETVKTHVYHISMITGLRRPAWWKVVQAMSKKGNPWAGLLP